MNAPTAESNPEVNTLAARPTPEETPEVVPEALTVSWNWPAPRMESYTPCPNCDAQILYGYGCEECGLSDPR